MAESNRLLTYEDLADRGWPLSRGQTWRLVRQGKFPEPIKLHETGQRNYWRAADVDEFMAKRQRAAKKR